MKTLDAMVELDALTGADPEHAHGEADRILIKFLNEYDGDCKELAGAWERACERCGFWYA